MRNHLTLTLAPDVITTPVDDGMTLFHERTGTIFHLNSSGATVLSALLDGGPEAAAQLLCTRYDTTTEGACRDVAALVEKLRAHRLVTGT